MFFFFCENENIYEKYQSSLSRYIRVMDEKQFNVSGLLGFENLEI